MRKKEWDPVKSSRRAARKAHFEAGGTLTTWMRPGKVMQDPKKVADRLECRGRPVIRED